jgi:hypothetical protein
VVVGTGDVFILNQQYATISGMAKHTKTAAAKLIGVVRQTIYDYIKQGRISVDADGLIDTSELIRAGFPLRLPDSSQDVGNGHATTENAVGTDTQPIVQDHQVHISKVVELYEQRIDSLEREIADARSREERLLSMLEQEQQQRQLYLPAPAEKHPSGFLSGVFSRKGSPPTQ